MNSNRGNKTTHIRDILLDHVERVAGELQHMQAGGTTGDTMSAWVSRHTGDIHTQVDISSDGELLYRWCTIDVDTGEEFTVRVSTYDRTVYAELHGWTQVKPMPEEVMSALNSTVRGLFNWLR